VRFSGSSGPRVEPRASSSAGPKPHAMGLNWVPKPASGRARLGLRWQRISPRPLPGSVGPGHRDGHVTCRQQGGRHKAHRFAGLHVLNRPRVKVQGPLGRSPYLLSLLVTDISRMYRSFSKFLSDHRTPSRPRAGQFAVQVAAVRQRASRRTSQRERRLPRCGMRRLRRARSPSAGSEWRRRSPRNADCRCGVGH
jgi:hypothetical protein